MESDRSRSSSYRMESGGSRSSSHRMESGGSRSSSHRMESDRSRSSSSHLARPGEHRMVGKRRLQEGGGARARKRVRCAAGYSPGRPCFWVSVFSSGQCPEENYYPKKFKDLKLIFFLRALTGESCAGSTSKSG